MRSVNIMECLNQIEKLGRVYSGQENEIYCNWTCSGIRLRFKGTCLLARMNAQHGEEMEKEMFTQTVKMRTLWPYAAVFLDDEETPIYSYEINDQNKEYLLFSCEKEEVHTITIRKITENAKGKLSVQGLTIEGVLLEKRLEKKEMKVEFIGDSITCGFGNMSNERDHMFYSIDENGWNSHAAIASRQLNASFSILSFSGITVSRGIGNFQWMIPSMPELYPYTDRVFQEAGGEKEEFEEWDFASNIPDVIVINLGTNDATLIEFNGEVELGIKKFEEDYYNFLEMIRDKNGFNAQIICTLGSMDYFLYDSIVKVAENFAKNKNDKKISCFKYGRMRITDGYGACGHPNLVTQKRMGDEIAAYIKQLLDRKERR